MNILMVSSYLPFPLYSGGHVRLYNLLKGLSKAHNVTLVCEKRDYQTQKDVDEVKKICTEVIWVERKQQWTLENIIKAGFSSYPFLMVGHTNSQLKLKIQECLQQKFDVIHIETFYVMQNLPKSTLPVVLAEHNIEYLVYKRFANKSLFLLKPFLYLDIVKMEYWEKRYWKKATKLVAVSPEEKNLMGRSDVEVVENGVDTDLFKMSDVNEKIKKLEKTILFIGDFKWMQNRDAVDWLLREIWPHLSAKFKVQSSKLQLKLWIVGRNIPDSIKDAAKDLQVIFDENSPLETHEIFKKADILLSPTRVGGGTSYKVLEAMASGVPVVTTSLGIEGIDVKSNQEVMLAENPFGMVQQINKLLDNKDLYTKIAIQARGLIEKKYSWENIVKRLEKVYESVIDH